MGPLIAAFVAVSALGALNGFVLLQAEMPLALARDGLLPAWVAKLNRNVLVGPFGLRRGCDVRRPLQLCRGLADLFQFMLLVTTSVTIIFYLLRRALRLGAAESRRRAAFSPSPPRQPYSVWAFYGAGIEASLWSLAMTALGFPSTC